MKEKKNAYIHNPNVKVLMYFAYNLKTNVQLL